MRTKRNYSVEGYSIEQKKTSPHSKTSRRVYVPVEWKEVVIIDITGRIENEETESK